MPQGATSGPVPTASSRPAARRADSRTPAARHRHPPTGRSRSDISCVSPDGFPESSPPSPIQPLDSTELSPRRPTRGARWIWLCIVNGAVGCSGPREPKRGRWVEAGPRSILVGAVGTEDRQDAEHCALHRPAVARESVSPPDDLAVAGGRLLRHVLPPEVFAATHIHGLAHGLIELSLAGPTTQAQAPEGWSPAA